MDKKINMPLVSIVTPAYNQADYLEETIKSILAQTYPNVEYIVIDDGSTDYTRDVLLRWDGKITWLSHENMGQANTLNKGWSLANGELVGYLSSDDLLDKNCIERLVSQYNNETCVIFPSYRLIDPKSRPIKSKKLVFHGYRAMVEDFICPIGPGALFSRCLLETHGGWNPEYRQIPDFDFWMRVGKNSKFIHLEEELASFRVHDGSQTFAVSTNTKADESVVAVENFFQADISHDVASQNKSMTAALVFSACLHLRSGRGGIAIARLRKAFTVGRRDLFRWVNIRKILGTWLSVFKYSYIKGMRKK